MNLTMKNQPTPPPRTRSEAITHARLELASCKDPAKRRSLIGRLGGLTGAGSLGRRVAAIKAGKASGKSRKAP